MSTIEEKAKGWASDRWNANCGEAGFIEGYNLAKSEEKNDLINSIADYWNSLESGEYPSYVEVMKLLTKPNI